jgi:hypothetical protein
MRKVMRKLGDVGEPRNLSSRQDLSVMPLS